MAMEWLIYWKYMDCGGCGVSSVVWRLCGEGKYRFRELNCYYVTSCCVSGQFLQCGMLLLMWWWHC